MQRHHIPSNERNQARDEIQRWSSTYLDPNGRYIGIDFRKVFKESDWPYRVGETVPVHMRYSAMLCWRWHQKALGMLPRS